MVTGTGQPQAPVVAVFVLAPESGQWQVATSGSEGLEILRCSRPSEEGKVIRVRGGSVRHRHGLESVQDGVTSPGSSGCVRNRAL